MGRLLYKEPTLCDAVYFSTTSSGNLTSTADVNAERLTCLYHGRRRVVPLTKFSRSVMQPLPLTAGHFLQEPTTRYRNGSNRALTNGQSYLTGLGTKVLQGSMLNNKSNIKLIRDAGVWHIEHWCRHILGDLSNNQLLPTLSSHIYFQLMGAALPGLFQVGKLK